MLNSESRHLERANIVFFIILRVNSVHVGSGVPPLSDLLYVGQINRPTMSKTNSVFGSAFFFLQIRIQAKFQCGSGYEYESRSSENIMDLSEDSKQLGLHPVLYVPYIFSKMCQILLSMSFFVIICLKKSLGF